MIPRTLFESIPDGQGDLLRVIAHDRGWTVGAAGPGTRWPGTTSVTAGWHAHTPGDLAALQDALADITCPASYRSTDGVALLLDSLADLVDALHAHQLTASQAAALGEAERLIGKALQEVSGDD